jgi:hypothetical protein
MFLGKGSFMVYGKREWYRAVPVSLCIGYQLDKGTGKLRVMSGTQSMMRMHASHYVTVQPGEIPATKLAKEIKSLILGNAPVSERKLVEKLPLDEIARLIPTGSGEVRG